MKKILFAIDSLSGGGAERVISIIANQTFYLGFDVGMVLTYGTSIQYEVEERIPIYNINGEPLAHPIGVTNNMNETDVSEVSESRTLVNKKFFMQSRECIAEYRDFIRRRNMLIHLVKEKNFDVVISFLTNTNMLVGSASQYMSAKTIISERSDPNKTVFNLRSGKRILRLYKKADIIVCQTKEALQSYPESIQRKGTTVPNPIKKNLPDRFTGQRRKEIITFGRLEESKNLELLINAYSEIYKEFPEYTLRIFGRGSQKDKLMKIIDSLELTDVAFVEDFRSNIHDVIRDAAMYVSTSNFEGVSNAMLEALAIGLPTICTNCPVGGARETIKNGVNGFLVPVNDQEKLVATIKKLIEDQDVAECISKQAVNVRREHSVERITQRWLEIAGSV